MDAKTKRGQYRSSTLRRQQILRTGVQIVDEQGPEALTIAAVARAIGVPDQTVQYHYSSRDHLLVGVVESREADDAAGLRAALDPEKDLTIEVFRNLLLPDPADNWLRLYSLLGGQSTVPGHPAAAFFAQRTRAALAGLAEIITRLQSSGEVHPELDAQAAARQVLGYVEGMVLAWLHLRDFDLPNELYQGVRRLLAVNWMDAVRRLSEPGQGL
ncbi:TetR/AcrR family transcriptional regulator [Microbacterium sp. NPDC089698]|uniref:TetR/AcrR family transcriptional regulator n=1 Tax=Microbacterium sp. NPDC089698 TaxID=3364200 RepID=UPI0038250F8A